VKIRIQIRQGAGQDELRREAALNFPGIDRAFGIWFLAERGSDRATPAPESGVEAAAGKHERVPTRIFNGYAEQVAGLYTDHKTEKLFM
jgi:hypothetical protein